MYEKFYGLREPPFNLTPDSRFLFLSHHHREAMAALLYGIRERKGFTLLTGEIGSGKTTLCRALVKELDGSGTQIALILNPHLSETELLQAINEELEIDASATSRKALIDALNRHLLDQFHQGRNVAIVLDEAQGLSESALEEIRLLGNLETEQQKLLQVVLIGQPELQAVLQKPQLQQLNQRIAVRYHLRALEPDEIEPYVHHRLRVAGVSVMVEFTPLAIKMLYEFTGGVPRKINLLCDRALLAGYVASTHTIDDAILRTAALDVGADQWAGTAAVAEPSGTKAAVSPPTGGYSFRTRLLSAITLCLILVVLAVLLSQKSLWVRGTGPPTADEPTSGTVVGLPGREQVLPPERTPTALTPRPAASTPSPRAEAAAPSFRLKPPKKADPWTYDDDQVVRVHREEFCRTASILTVLAAWGIEVNLQDFRRLTVADVQRLNVVEANRDLGLREVEVPGGLKRALAYDLPILVEIDDPEKRLSHEVVLLGVTSDTCRIADPMKGMQDVPRLLFESFWWRAWAIYFDTDNLDTLARGARSEGVRVLQQALSDLGFYRGFINGEFDRATVSAIEALQNHFELFPTDRLDPLTVMLVASHRHSDRPRLIPKREKGK